MGLAFDNFDTNANLAAMPEPDTLALFMLGAIMLLAYRARRGYAAKSAKNGFSLDYAIRQKRPWLIHR